MATYNTPLRYPGGKQKLTPFVVEVLEENNLLGGHYVEPYAGGAGVAVELLVNNLVEEIHLNDVSRHIYAFWRAVLNQTDELCARILSASMTVDEWRRQKEILTSHKKHRQIDVAFSLLFLNRCNRSGILTAGVIGGNDQTGNWRMDARFPRNELIRRIEVIGALRSRITVTCMDAEEYLTNSYVRELPERSLVYCDPPYFKKAERLYLNHYSAGDHSRIADIIQSEVKLPWIVSYDAVAEILELYEARNQFQYSLQYNAAKTYKGQEVFIFSDGLTLPPRSRVKSIDNVLTAIG